MSTKSKRIRKERLRDVLYTGSGRKTEAQQKLLIQYFELYQGKWNDEVFSDLINITGFNKKQLNKWFWDRKKKVKEALKAKKLAYPGLIF